jgi:hypothetical protein
MGEADRTSEHQHTICVDDPLREQVQRPCLNPFNEVLEPDPAGPYARASRGDGAPGGDGSEHPLDVVVALGSPLSRHGTLNGVAHEEQPTRNIRLLEQTQRKALYGRSLPYGPSLRIKRESFAMEFPLQRAT